MSKYLQPGDSIKVPGFVSREQDQKDMAEFRANYLMELGEKRAKENAAKQVIWVYGDNGWENKGHPGEWEPPNFGDGLVARILPVGQIPEDPKKKKSLLPKLYSHLYSKLSIFNSAAA